jgi:histidinol-phosphate aminotransferase
MYSVSADTNDVGIVDVPLRTDFHLQTDEVIATATGDSDIKLMFLCSPGNPTCVALKTSGRHCTNSSSIRTLY